MFDGLDITIAGSSGDAKAAISSLRASLSGLERSANSAGDSMEEMGDDATGAGARLGTLSASAAASALSVAGLTSATTGATASLTSLGVSTGVVTTALIGLAAIASPLTATLGTLAAAAGGLATAFGAVVGSGLLAFGQERAEQNQQELAQTRERIAELERLEDAEGNLTAAQKKELTQLEQKEESLSEATNATGALARVASELKQEIVPLVVELGEKFIPLIEDAVDALPGLVEDIIAALGPLDEFRNALRDFGAAAAEAIPAIVESLVDLGRRALPFVTELASAIGDGAAGAFESMIGVTEQVGDDLLAIADAIGSFLPDLTELGVNIIETITPAFNSFVGAVESVIERINEFAGSDEAADIFETMREELGPLVPRIVDLGEELGPVIDTLIDNVPEITRGLAAFGDSVLDIAEVAVPPLATALEKLIDGIGFLSESYADWVEASERSERRLNSDIQSIRQVFETAVDKVRGAWSYLTGSGPDTLRGDVIDQLSQLRSWLSSAWDLYPLSDTFEAVAATITGDGDSGGIIPTLKSDVKETLSQLRSWLSSAWDLHPLSDAFDAAIEAIGDAFSRLNFGPFESALDAVADGVQTLIDSLNELSGVDIDVDIPSFDGLLDRAEEIVEPEPEPEPEPPDDDDDDPSTGVGSGIGGSIPGAPSDPDNDGTVREPRGRRPNPLATGGFVEGAGAAMLHAGERVLPESQVSDRGEASFDPDSVAKGVDNSSAVQELSAKLDRMNGLLSSLDQGDVSQKDVLRALDVARDRRSGRDPFDA